MVTNCYLLLIILFNTIHSFAQSNGFKYSFICTQLYVSKYFYVLPIILFLLNGFKYCNLTRIIQHYLFVFTQLNGFKYSYVALVIKFNISHLFAQVKQFYLTYKWHPNSYYHQGQNRPGSNSNKAYSTFPQSSTTRASPSDCLVLYSGPLLRPLTSLQR